jgi:hypothetical protein
MNLRTLATAFVIALALIGSYFGVKATIQEVRTYQALKGEHAAILKYLGETVATDKDKDGKEVSINRAMLIDALLKQATAPQTPTPPPVK